MCKRLEQIMQALAANRIRKLRDAFKLARPKTPREVVAASVDSSGEEQFEGWMCMRRRTIPRLVKWFSCLHIIPGSY